MCHHTSGLNAVFRMAADNSNNGLNSMNLQYTRRIVSIILLCLPLSVVADVRLPQLLDSGMVLQRNVEIVFWGWADPGEKVRVDFDGATYHSTADNSSGEWRVTLPEKQAGGPYTIEIQGKNRLVLNNILIGDLWIASGQSNMELNMARVEPLYAEEIRAAHNTQIRYFEVPDSYNFEAPQNDLESGSWQQTTPETVLQFSAVAHFFAKNIQQSQGVPIGIIDAALGGSPVEAWISEETLKQFPEPYAELQRFKDEKLIQRISSDDQERISAWHKQLDENDKGLRKDDYVWAAPALDTESWHSMAIPGYWSEPPKAPQNGVVWFRKNIKISADVAGQSAKLILGRIVDADSVFVNGVLVGSTGYQYPPRRYEIPAGLLKAGDNTIAVRVISEQGHGGFVLDKAYKLQFPNSAIDLTGEWLYKRGATMKPLASPTFIRWKPTGLYNAMIAPLHRYPIRGVIWYQGESNVGKADDYRERFSTMIEDWRDQWGQGDFPFLFAQLANYLEPSSHPSDSNWALLREAQLETLSLPNTAMAVTIDVGEWNDIHPLNKKAVGDRLAAAAQKIAYGEKLVHSGPIFESAQIEGNQVILNFKHKGSGLIAEGGGKLKQFAIASADRKFVWAQAEIRGNKIVVWSDEIENPEAVRYAWSDNPEGANLFNKEGLPASPFRTDNW
jgi:sialate O-acetylesterase